MIPVSKLAWMAAVIDLKGKLYSKKNALRATPQVVLAVESINFAVVRELSSLTGTSPEFAMARQKPDWMKRGCTEHCPEPHIHYEGSLPPKARWTVTGASAAVILYNIMPYLVAHDQPWQEILDQLVGQASLNGQGSGVTLRSLRRLKELGWEMPRSFEVVLAEQGKEE